MSDQPAFEPPVQRMVEAFAANRAMRICLAVLLSLVVFGVATLAAAAEGPGEVAPVVIPTGPGPGVRSTYPAAGGTVPAGVLILKIVFDQTMSPGAWSYGRSADGDFPDCLAEARLLNDQRTYVLLCSVQRNRAYAVEINPTPQFANADGRSAKPYVLKFSTTDDITRALHDALVEAGLDDTDEPIMTWRDPGQGVSQSAPPP
jgi:hypothetical protein